jgi:hypothetical protein
VTRDGAAVPSAALRIIVAGGGFGWESTRQAFSDEAGRFDVSGLPRKKLELVALGETAASDGVAVDLEATAERTDLTVTLDVEGSIAGIVVDPKGQPVPEAQVAAVPEVGGGRRDPSRWRLRGLPRDVTDSGGRFELTGLAQDTYLVRAARGNVNLQEMMMRSATPAEVGDKELRIVLEDDGGVKGKVLYADGTPPEVYFVSVGFGRGPPLGGGDGAFELDAPAGKVMVTVTGPSFVQKTVPDVEVKPGEITDVGTINVEKGRSIAGRVLRGDGSLVAGAKVVAGPQLIGSGSELSQGGLFGGGGLKSATSDEDGNYVLSGVGAGGLVIAADHADGRTAMVRLPAGDQSMTLDLVLRPAGALEGKVSSSGKPVSGTMVIASPQQAARGNLMVQTGEDGGYRFDKLAADTYRVSALERSGMMGGGMHAKVVTVEPEKTAHLDLEIPAGGVTVSLRVAPPAGVTVTAAQVFLVTGGKIVATTADQFIDAFGELGDGAAHQGWILKGEPAKLANVAPGGYSACAIPIPGDINSPRDMMKLRDQMNKLVVACQPVAIKDRPAEQEVTITVPAPPAL